MQKTDVFSTEIFFTPAWFYRLSKYLGDLKGQVGYINDYGLIELIGEKDPDITKNHIESKTDGATKCITACKSMAKL